MEEAGNSVEKKLKKEKKSKKAKLVAEPYPDDSDSNSDGHHKKKKEKKRKALEIDGNEEERSETSSELGEPTNGLDKKKNKTVKLESEDEEGEKEENPNAVSNFRISTPLMEALKGKGIESLFPIQAMTFDMILDGSDLVGRARTGQARGLKFCF